MLGGAAGLGVRPDEGGRVESRGGNSILPFSCGLPGGFAPGSCLAFLAWLGVLPWGLRPRSLGSFVAAPQYLDFGVEVGTDLVQPLV